MAIGGYRASRMAGRPFSAFACAELARPELSAFKSNSANALVRSELPRGAARRTFRAAPLGTRARDSSTPAPAPHRRGPSRPLASEAHPIYLRWIREEPRAHGCGRTSGARDPIPPAGMGTIPSTGTRGPKLQGVGAWAWLPSSEPSRCERASSIAGRQLMAVACAELARPELSAFKWGRANARVR